MALLTKSKFMKGRQCPRLLWFANKKQLPALLKIKYHAINDATELLGGVDKIRDTFIDFQKHLFAVPSD